MKKALYAVLFAILSAVTAVFPISAEGTPATNDSANMTLWWIILGACAVLIVVVLIMGKMRKR
ncbi:MAG: hypothetical protein J5938_05625 [Clostridia bacterium]|nr:hypothetical protein [Clostridia bacterium]